MYDDGSLELCGRYRVRVPNVLPSWLTMCWTVHDPEPPADGPRDQHDSTLPRIVFGEAVVATAQAPSNDVSTIAIERGDLVLETNEQRYTYPMYHVDDLAVALATACEDGATGLEDRLICHLARGGPQSPNPEALKMLVRGYARSPRACSAIKDALRSPSLEIRLISAIALGEEGFEELERIVCCKDAPTDIRRQAIEVLSTKHRHGALLTALDQAPEGVERNLLQALQAAENPNLERVVLPFLKSEDEKIVESAADVLARSGTRMALVALHAATKRRFSIQTMNALNVAVELIGDRLELGTAAGALALVEADGTTGSLSMSEQETGALSTVNDDEPVR
ncbi:MAG: hypothetical protein H6729_15715 [Deltaproteobacteria bacterium]|nr:hypothetical protein [Deltaproteobacteria bacterium]